MVRRIESLVSESATLQAYLREIAGFPQLTPDAEQQLGREFQQHGDEEALNRLVQSNLRFVVGYARRFRHLGVPLLDLIHQGNLGLIEAARRFDPNTHGTLRSHARWWVRQGVMHVLSASWRMQAVTSTGLMGAAADGRHVEALRLAVEHAPALEALAREADTSGSDVELAYARDTKPSSRRPTGPNGRRGGAGSNWRATGALRQQAVLRSYLN